MPSKIEVTSKSILHFFLILGGLWLLFYIRDILFLLFVSFILMSGLRPSIERLTSMKFPRPVAILIMFLLLIALIAIFVSIIAPPLVTQTTRLITNLPNYLSQLAPFVNLNFDSLLPQVGSLGQNVARLTVSIFSNFFTLITIGVFAFYFLLERNNLRSFLEAFLGTEVGDKAIDVIKKVEIRLGAWVRGQLLLGFIIGLSTYIGLTILGVSYALPLSLIAGVLELVPIIGPIISAVPSILVALTISPGLALAVVAFYIIIQQLENNLIVPTVMVKTVGLPPLASLLALMIGGRLGGTLGIILAIPTLLVIQTVVQELLTNQSRAK